MFLKKLTLSNYRSIKEDLYEIEFGTPNGNEGSGLTIIVGPNNVGKSNIFHALDFLFNKGASDNVKNKQRPDSDSVVTAEFVGPSIESTIDEYVQDNKKDALKLLVYSDSEQAHFSIQRKMTDKIGAITIWDQTKSEFVNVTGIDAPIQKWLQILPLWANTTTEEIADYSAKSIIGELLSKIVEEIQSGDDYRGLHQQFQKIFGSGSDSVLTSKTNSISEQVSELIKEQFQNIDIKFHADPPKIDQYVKQIKTLVDDGDQTDISQKGHGLQRAIMIALIQIYSDSLNTGAIKKPFYLFIDEPELYLNPQAQKILLKALRKISANEQIFLVTHSPYFFDWVDFTSGAKIGRAHKENDSTVLCWLKPETDYASLISNDVSDWQKPHLLDVTAKELLFTNKVLFLEGQEDVGLIRKWLRENSKDISFDLFGYGVGGFSNFSTFLNMASDLGLLKVAAIYDMGENETAAMTRDNSINEHYKLIQLTANDIRDKYEPCHQCDECQKKNYKSCIGATQTKDGCFTSGGDLKPSNNGHAANFLAVIEDIITYMAS